VLVSASNVENVCWDWVSDVFGMFFCSLNFFLDFLPMVFDSDFL